MKSLLCALLITCASAHIASASPEKSASATEERKVMKVGDNPDLSSMKVMVYDKEAKKDKDFMKEVSLDQYKDEILVLEWYNAGCPFVKKYYEKGYMQKLHEMYESKVKWVLVISSAKGKEGFKDLSKEDDRRSLDDLKAHAIIIDDKGTLGRAFDAKKTPTMVIVNKGKMIYHGAVTGGETPEYSDKEPKYFELALNTLLGQPTEGTEAYGCGVKYDESGAK